MFQFTLWCRDRPTKLVAKNQFQSRFSLNRSFVVFTNTQNWQYWHYFQLCILRNLQFSSLFALHDASKCKIRYQWVKGDYIWRLWNSLFLLISNDTAKTKLAILAFLYCGEFVKKPLFCGIRQICIRTEKNTAKKLLLTRLSRTKFGPCWNHHEVTISDSFNIFCTELRELK